MTDHNELVEKVALAMSKVEWCGAKVGDELCLCDDPRLPDDARQDECLCRKQAPAAIAAARPTIRAEALEDAAKVAEYRVGAAEWSADTNSGYECAAREIAAAIRALKDKP